ncbi:MAG: hypothetical protein Q7R34_05315 [Dehalococcoidia bacterium]|nr:hypothetical protein [Dehalococcoidia bacterium]
MKRNNVAVERVEKTVAEFKSEPGKARRTQRVEGVWNFIEGKPQFSATVVFDGKSAVLEADQPSFLGAGAPLNPDLSSTASSGWQRALPEHLPPRQL